MIIAYTFWYCFLLAALYNYSQGCLAVVHQEGISVSESVMNVKPVTVHTAAGVLMGLKEEGMQLRERRYSLRFLKSMA